MILKIEKLNNAWVKTLLAFVIFAVSFAAYYYPVQKKGYAPGAGYSNLTQARNFALSGTYFNESADGVYLSSSSAREKGAPIGMTNSLTPIIYGYVFKYFGFNPLLPLYVALTLFSLFNVLVFLLVARLFGVAIGFVSSMAGSFMPVMSVGAVHGGFYEWGVIFFSLALWAYLGSKDGPFKADKLRITTASIFFALSALSRNAFAVSFIPFFLYDFFVHRSYKRSLLFLLPFLVIFGSTLTSFSWLGVPNGYTASQEQQPFSQPGHFFNDPYSFYFEKESFVAEKLDKRVLNRHEVNMAVRLGEDVSFRNWIGAYSESIKFYISNTVNLTSVGGPLVWGLIILGVFQLYYLDKKLLGLFIFWPFLLFGYLVYALTGNWDHLMEIIFIISTLAGLGLYRLVQIMSSGTLKKVIIGPIVLVLLMGHLAYANKWKLHDVYRSSKEEIILDAVGKLKGQGEIGGVYAVGIHPSSVQALNYYINHDMVYFNTETVGKLIQSDELKSAFNKYDISVAIGYSPEISEKIKQELKIPVY